MSALGTELWRGSLHNKSVSIFPSQISIIIIGIYRALLYHCMVHLYGKGTRDLEGEGGGEEEFSAFR